MASFPIRRTGPLLPGLIPPGFRPSLPPAPQPIWRAPPLPPPPAIVPPRPIFDMWGNPHPDFSQQAPGPPGLPFALRQVGLLGGALQPPKQFPELGAFRFRSAQALANMTLPERKFYEAGLALQGLSPLDIQEFLRQEQLATRPAPLPYRRFMFGPSPFVRGPAY